LLQLVLYQEELFPNTEEQGDRHTDFLFFSFQKREGRQDSLITAHDKNGALQTAKDGGFSDHQWLYCSTFGANANRCRSKPAHSHIIYQECLFMAATLCRNAIGLIDGNWAKHCASLARWKQIRKCE